jgi:predicted enzyme related to lactoylglutathione lyase
MEMKYKHTNIVARDWKKLAAFYETVFGCERVPPERHLSGGWLDKGTGVKNAAFSGVHLRLPGWGNTGPTLEIYQYTANQHKLPAAANREGFGHIAFEVSDVRAAADSVVRHGGSFLGEITTADVEGVGSLTFVYLADPEGNIIELQAWNK